MYNILFFFQLIDRSERNDENGGGEGEERSGMTWIVRDVVKLVH